MGFSENLRNARRAKNLSQEQLAELLNLSRQSVSKWEADGGYPETEKLIQIAKILETSLDLLLMDKQPTLDNNDIIMKSNLAFSEDRKITIQSYDGGILAAFFKFKIVVLPFHSKNEPKCVLYGIDRSSFMGDNINILGWYVTEEDAQKELSGISKAMRNGEGVYELKHYVKVKKGIIAPKIIN